MKDEDREEFHRIEQEKLAGCRNRDERRKVQAFMKKMRKGWNKKMAKVKHDTV